jgi:hypothetical protein
VETCSARVTVKKGAGKGAQIFEQQDVQARKFFMVAHNVCGFLVWNLFHVALKVPRIFRRLVNVGKNCAPMGKGKFSLYMSRGHIQEQKYRFAHSNLDSRRRQSISGQRNIVATTIQLRLFSELCKTGTASKYWLAADLSARHRIPRSNNTARYRLE